MRRPSLCLPFPAQFKFLSALTHWGISRSLWRDQWNAAVSPYVLPFPLNSNFCPRWLFDCLSHLLISNFLPRADWFVSCYCLWKFSGSFRLRSLLQSNVEQNEWKVKRGNKKCGLYWNNTQKTLFNSEFRCVYHLRRIISSIPTITKPRIFRKRYG